MKRRATAGRKSVQHKMYMTALDHRRTGFYTALIVLAVPAIPAMPGVRALNHPAFLQRREAFRARRTRLHFEAPVSTMRNHPGVQGMVVILLIRKDRHETWNGHCQLHGKSLIDPFLVRKVDGLQVAKIQGGVKEENER